MALLGGGVGGAGNPVGGSFTGPSLGLEYILDRCYGYSGSVQTDTTTQTLLEFTTGNVLIVGEITCVGATANNGAGITAGAISVFTLSFNGGEIARFKSDTRSASDWGPPSSTYPIIIPAYTEVKLEVLSGDATAGMFTTCLIAGQTFKTRD